MGQSFEIFEKGELDSAKYYQSLGRSFDSAFLEEGSFLLKEIAKEEGASPEDDGGDFLYKFCSDQQDFSSTVTASASGKASFRISKVKASAKLSRFLSSNSYSCYIFGYVRLVKPRMVFDLTETTLEPNMERIIKDNYRTNKDFIEKKLGDEVIIGISLSSEILVKLEIQTSSETEKKSVKASFDGSWGKSSSSSKVSGLTDKITSSKQIVFQAYGNIPNEFAANSSPEEVEKFLFEFPKRSLDNYSIRGHQTIPADIVPQLLKFEIVNTKELNVRRKFVKKIDLLYQDLIDWENDILYVVSDTNKNEFTNEIRNHAIDHLKKCKSYQDELNEILTTASIFWTNNGKNGDMFSLNLLSHFSKNLYSYPRIEPSKPETAATTPQPKPPREHEGGHPGR
jgi:hypothetical protein